MTRSCPSRVRAVMAANDGLLTWARLAIDGARRLSQLPPPPAGRSTRGQCDVASTSTATLWRSLDRVPRAASAPDPGRDPEASSADVRHRATTRRRTSTAWRCLCPAGSAHRTSRDAARRPRGRRYGVKHHYARFKPAQVVVDRRARGPRPRADGGRHRSRARRAVRRDRLRRRDAHRASPATALREAVRPMTDLAAHPADRTAVEFADPGAQTWHRDTRTAPGECSSSARS